MALASTAKAEQQPPPAGGKEAVWPYAIELGPAGGKDKGPPMARLWLPPGVKVVRGLFYPGGIVIGGALSHDQVVRATLAELNMGVVTCGVGLGFVKGGGEKLEHALAELAQKSGHPEVEFAPLLTCGHSTDGIFCRNVAYWKPDRVIGVLMLKSGNFHHNIEDMSRTLAGVPLILISGEFEEYGPEGGDLGVGLRSEYSSFPTDKTKRNQTQWVMARMQMIERRRKNPENLWALVVHRGRGHCGWDDEMRDMTCKIIRSFAAARIPKGEPDGKTEVHCTPLTVKDGWLFDADIKNPKHQAAPYAQYDGDKILAYWVPDKTLAEAICEYHNRGWDTPDPTASDPPEKRFCPPAMLRDLVDAPPPRPLDWKGGDGAWNAEDANWVDAGKDVPWDEGRMAVFKGKVGTVTLAGKLVCHGLQLGKGYTLDVGEQSLRARWHVVLDDESAIRLRVVGDPTAKSRAGRLTFDGNTKFGGTLTIEAAGEFPKGGTVSVMSCGGLVQGEFKQVVLPEGWEMKRDRRGWAVVIPKPAPPAKKK
jgi:hypothetical protein